MDAAPSRGVDDSKGAAPDDPVCRDGKSTSTERTTILTTGCHAHVTDGAVTLPRCAPPRYCAAVLRSAHAVIEQRLGDWLGRWLGHADDTDRGAPGEQNSDHHRDQDAHPV